MSKEAKILIGIAVVVIGVGILLAMQEPKPDPTFDKPADAGQLVREDSNIKGGKDAKVTVVEFLDFECEACRASYPVVKQVLAEYGDKVKFVQRYFPLPNHKNSQSAALAAAAAGEQGKFSGKCMTNSLKTKVYGLTTMPKKLLNCKLRRCLLVMPKSWA